MIDGNRSNEEKAQNLLQPGQALLLAQSQHIEHLHTLTATKSVDLVSLVIKALKSLKSKNPDDAELYLTELLAVLISEQLQLNEALGFELTVRDDAHKVVTLATQILLGEADECEAVAGVAESQVESEFEKQIDKPNTEEEK